MDSKYPPFAKGRGGPGVPLPKEPLRLKHTGTPMKRPMIVAMKLDGVLAAYDVNRGVTEIGRPIEGSRALCEWIIDECKAKLIIMTGRRRADLVKVWLEQNKIKYTTINQQVGENAQGQCSQQVVADIYFGNDFHNVDQGHFKPVVDHIQVRLGELLRAGERADYDW